MGLRHDPISPGVSGTRVYRWRTTGRSRIASERRRVYESQTLALQTVGTVRLVPVLQDVGMVLRHTPGRGGLRQQRYLPGRELNPFSAFKSGAYPHARGREPLLRLARYF